MTDATSGSAMLAGNPAGDTAAATTGGNDAASTTGMTGASGASTGDIGKPTDTSTGNWYDAIEDNDLKGYAQNKGWKDPVEVLNGYRNLEKLVGSEKLPMPKGAEDKEGWARVYDSLGRPKTAEEYKLPVPEGQQPSEFTKAAAGKFHELGLSSQQAEGLAAWWNDQQTGAQTQIQQQSAQKAEADFAALKSEWGGAYDENVNYGQRAAKEFGLDATKLSAIENAMGTGEMMKFMARIGRGLTEDSFKGGDTGGSKFGMTPEAARSRVAELRSDQAWATKYMSGDVEAQNEMKRLMALAYPEG
jgi:hypothetical protein